MKDKTDKLLEILDIPSSELFHNERNLENLLGVCCLILGWVYIKNLTHIDGKGVPDRTIVTHKGLIAFVELKHPNGNGMLNVDQYRYSEKLKEQGYPYFLINNSDEIKELIHELNDLDPENCITGFNENTLVTETIDIVKMFGCTFDRLTIPMIEDQIEGFSPYWCMGDEHAYELLEYVGRLKIVLKKLKDEERKKFTKENFTEESETTNKYLDFDEYSHPLSESLKNANIVVLLALLKHPILHARLNLSDRFFSNKFYKWWFNEIVLNNRISYSDEKGLNCKTMYTKRDKTNMQVLQNLIDSMSVTDFPDKEETFYAVKELKLNYIQRAIDYHERFIRKNEDVDYHKELKEHFERGYKTISDSTYAEYENLRPYCDY